MSKQPGQDFEDFMKEARQDPEISAYWDSFSVAVGNGFWQGEPPWDGRSVS
ncbi:hypothetical protein ACE41H_23420 [Paenibacillus enshidis]|uniref:Uncharacterized protein n=1 Tax=Paenibacillus enshidis TaxID=1458439 RepID=A0ABV5B2S6_9BACL